ncbi:MAG: hypothetical protein H7319_22680 [Spirosoma sp.]|nr:hypothetical protein [Spirosoma sp.]
MKRYLTSALVYLFGISAMLYACKSGEATPTDSIRLGTNQSGRLASGVIVRVDSIRDSRCPSDAVCIWEGNATISLLVSVPSDSTRVKLILGPDPSKKIAGNSDSMGIQLDNQAYKVILRDVNPYPTTTNLSQAKTAVVQVSKL